MGRLRKRASAGSGFSAETGGTDYTIRNPMANPVLWPVELGSEAAADSATKLTSWLVWDNVEEEVSISLEILGRVLENCIRLFARRLFVIQPFLDGSKYLNFKPFKTSVQDPAS